MEEKQKQFNRVKISTNYFKEAISFLNEYDESLSETIRKALLISAVITYASPFGKNKASEEATSMFVGKPKKILGANGYKLHEKIIKLRNEAVAHSEYKRNPTKSLEFRSTGYFTRSRFFDILSEELDVVAFKENIEKMKQYCEHKLFVLSEIITSKKAN